MKTTIDLPDEILHRAKIVAARRKTTVKALVIEGLTHSLSSPVDSEALRRKRADRLLVALRAENTEPMKPLSREEIHDRSKLF